jgi:hypothetical protein
MLRSAIWSAEAASGFDTKENVMLTKMTLALALALAVIQAVPASAGPSTCGSETFQYDSSGATVGPYCH